MNTPLFKKTGNNKFQLLTENTTTQPKTNEVIQLSNGLKKIFCEEGITEVSYNRVQNMGFGFIKDIHSAKLVALEESRILAEEFGYRDDVDNAKFIKEDGEVSDYDRASAENPTSQPAPSPEELTTGKNAGWSSKSEEKREVQIGKEIINKTQILVNKISEEDWGKYVTPIQALANELIQMHGAK